VHNNDNGSWSFNELNVVTNGGNAYAIYGQNGANINIGENAEILTSGVSSYGVHANNASVNIDDDVLISTNNTDARAVYSTSNGNINIGDDAQIITYGPDFPTQSRNHAVYVELASNVTFGDNAYIFTSGVGSGGVYTYAATGNTNNHILFGDNATIITTGGDPNCGQCGLSPTTGWWSYGVYLSTKDSDVTFGDNAFISTQGARAFAVVSSNTNTAVYFGDNAAIFTDGNNGSAAVYASGGGKVEVGDNAVIATTGSAVSGTGLNPPHAIWVSGVSGLATNSTFIAGDNVNITTYGYDASGITASSYAFVTLGDNARITTYGEGRVTGDSSSNEGGFGIKIRGSLSNLAIGDNALITTYGNQALGVQVRERSSAVFGDGLTILTHGNTATALETFDRSNVTVGDNALIATTGNASHAVRTTAYTTAGNATTIIGKNSVISTEGDGSHAILSDGRSAATTGANIILNTNTSISASGNNSYAMYALNANGLITTNSSSKLNILGDMTAKSGGNIDLDLKDGSYFYGDTQIDTTSGINLAFDGSNSIWRVKGNSSLTNLSLTNNAKVDLTHSNSALSNPTSLIVDNILGDAGIFNVRVDINNNISDKIFVSNSSLGTHTISFNDKTLGGYQDNVSLQVIQNNPLNPESNYQANFTGHADIGAYTYALLFDNNTQSYYIGDVTPSGAIAPEGSITLNNAAVASSMGFLTINYLSNYINTQNVLQRMGELRDKKESDNDIKGDVWIRTYTGKLGSFDDNTRIDSIGYYGIQIGADKLSYLNNAKLYTGLTFGYLKADADYKAGDSESKLYDFGVYALYKNDNDFYIDAFIKYSEDKNSFNVKTSNNLTIDGSGKSRGFSLSVETGKRYDINSNVYIEPQAELTYTKQGEFGINSSNDLKTKIDGYNSYLLRGSIVFGYSLKDTANVYLKTGYIRELDGKTSYLFNNNAKQEYKLNQNIFDNAIGLTLNSNSHNLYLEGGWQKGDKFDNLKANVGYRRGF
jgi:outer membrane autotransporter protein